MGWTGKRENCDGGAIPGLSDPAETVSYRVYEIIIE